LEPSSVGIGKAWFSLLTRRAIRHAAFKSVTALREAIQRFLYAWNDHAHPFVWVKTADQILAKVDRKRSYVAVH
jgi:hypothetical protein